MQRPLWRPRRALTIAAALACAATAASGQVPGAPVLQNAFANSGLAAAGNFGGGGGQSFYGVAGALGAGRLQLSAAAGVQRANGSTRGAYGGRLAAPLWSSSGGSLGVAGFVGVGGGMRTRVGTIVTNAAEMMVPVGLSVGYRRAIGATRGVSVYLSPMYRWTRSSADIVSTAGAARVAGGVDFALSPSFGVTVGGEAGGGQQKIAGSSLIGAAITFVPGRR
jgi:hypothetical protein